MNDIEALLAKFESRGVRVTLHPNGKLTAGPPGKLTDSDRANLTRHRAGILRRLQERTPPTTDLSSDDAERKPGWSSADCPDTQPAFALGDDAKRPHRPNRPLGTPTGLAPSPSTNTDGVRFAIEEVYQSKIRPLVRPTGLKRGGIRVIRHTPGLRLGIEFWR